MQSSAVPDGMCAGRVASMRLSRHTFLSAMPGCGSAQGQVTVISKGLRGADSSAGFAAGTSPFTVWVDPLVVTSAWPIPVASMKLSIISSP